MKELIDNFPISENIEKAHEEFAESLRRQSYMIWDNLGLNVSLDDLPTQPIYKLCTELISGPENYFTLRGKLLRLWCRKIRPKLFPETQKLIEQAYENICILQKEALFKSVLEQARKRDLYE
jgi:hypothetical protein